MSKQRESGCSPSALRYPMRTRTWPQWILAVQSTHPCGVRLGEGVCAKVFGHFNPRTPCGVRLHCDDTLPTGDPFQSTHPLRGATKAVNLAVYVVVISIHAPLAGCDRRGGVFYSFPLAISIHAPLAGCDVRWRQDARAGTDFNPRTPCGVRLHGMTVYPTIS